jgi:GNAT superfamily N-acetyltransferase
MVDFARVQGGRQIQTGGIWVLFRRFEFGAQRRNRVKDAVYGWTLVTTKDDIINYACRKYQQEDLKTLQRLMLELGYCVTLTELRNNIREIDKKGGQLFVAEKDGEVVGSVCILMDARLAEGVYAEIVNLIVSEKERGKGIGKELVQEAEAWAGQRVSKVRVRANEIRSSAHAFYKKKQGYEEIKTQKIFIKMV